MKLSFVLWFFKMYFKFPSTVKEISLVWISKRYNYDFRVLDEVFDIFNFFIHFMGINNKKLQPEFCTIFSKQDKLCIINLSVHFTTKHSTSSYGSFHNVTFSD